MRITRKAKIAAVVAAAALALTGCASTASTTEEPGKELSAAGQKVYVIGGACSDGFFSPVKNGALAAGKSVEEAGGSVEWLCIENYDNFGPDIAKQINNAVAGGATAIAVPNWVPTSEDEAIQSAIAAGVAVTIYNSGGIEAANRVGAIGYFGSDEAVAGEAGGKYLAENGAKNILCVIAIPGATNLEARCAGVLKSAKAAGIKATVLTTAKDLSGDPTAFGSAVTGALTKDGSIDAVVTMGSSQADAAAEALAAASLTETVKLGTFDMNANVLDRIKGGTQLFAIDQQPFLQSYMATSAVWLYAQYGILPATTNFLTGPAIVDSNNVDKTIAGVADGYR